MSAETLENRIREYICNVFEVEYNKPLPITIDGNNYICTLYLNKQHRPIIIQGEFEDEEAFYAYIIKELNIRNLHHVHFSNLIKRLDQLEESTN